MDGSVRLEECLAEALANLYNPTYRPAASLWPLLGLATTASLDALRLALIDVVEALKPAAGSPDTSDATRLYRILRSRYVEGMTQRETAERLNMSERHLRREQQRAVELVLQRQGQLHPMQPDAPPVQQDRITQIRRELQSLMQSAPGEMSDVDAIIRSAIKISQASGLSEGIALRSAFTPSQALSTIHRAVLREVMITAIERMISALSSGAQAEQQKRQGIVAVEAEQQGGVVKVTITGSPMAADQMPAPSLFVNEALAAAGGAAEIGRIGERATFSITMPAADHRRILVLEDNTDLVHLYRQYTAGTRYEIVHVAIGEDILQAARAARPDLIVMDILLPNVDGWEMLNIFHEHPDTCSIPVIVCSVVRREELSLALGAELYLQKPVSLAQFIQGLDQVLRETAPRG